GPVSCLRRPEPSPERTRRPVVLERASRPTAPVRDRSAMAAIAISDPQASARTANPYAELKRRVEAAGLLGKRPGYYVLMLVTNTLAFGTSLWLLTLVQDRKSTRLNSSHEWISYAVFCLKKKKND